LQAAMDAAVQFARAHGVELTDSSWIPDSLEWATKPNGYDFNWNRVLNASGVRMPFDLGVYVDGTTGAVDRCAFPPERITGPTVPAISEAQARQIARQIAPMDPEQVPLTSTILRLSEDQLGVQRLLWDFIQHFDTPPDWPDGEPLPPDGNISVDAITGEAAIGLPLGSPMAERSRRGLARLARTPPRRLPRPLSTWVRVKGGKTVKLDAASLQPEARLRQGRLWIRAEYLRALDARVLAEPGRLKVRAGSRCVDGDRIGAHYQENGWWVPVRGLADALGWSTMWLRDSRTAVLDPRGAPGKGTARSL